jgi:redox-sensitive bicupin YhaK (pirin superfamily)
MSAIKRILSVINAPDKHWVGDGFPVHGMFNYQQHAQLMSPFLLLDYASPMAFEPLKANQHRRGVGSHPHRGFETVTIVYKGEVAHRDSTGKGGEIGPGDVQWMTAGSGILHEEFHSEHFSQTGGEMEMMQLWVNLPAKDKLTAPGYQAIVDTDIPSVTLANEAGRVRVIAGEFESARGPAHTFTPMNVWDVRLQAQATAELTQPDGWTTALVVMQGTISVNHSAPLSEKQMIVLGRDGAGVSVKASSDAMVLLLAGEPINEPVAAYGPFVMNTQQEIRQAMTDFNSGKFGQI